MQNLYKLILVIFIIFVFTFSSGQSFYYAGIMGDGLAIQMKLTLDGQKVSGHYYYDQVGIPLRLEGKLEEDNRIRLEEYAEDINSSQLTGTFNGSLSSSMTEFGDTFTGEWVNNYGNLFSFSLKKIAEYVDFDLTQNRIETSSRYPYFIAPHTSTLNNLLQDDFIQRQTDFLHEGQEVLKANELYNSWTLDSTTQISYYSDDLISLTDSSYLYTGGAHGYVVLDSYNFALNDMDIRILELRDMFTARADFMSLLNPFLIDRLGQQEAQWIIDGSISSFSEGELQIFTISPQGLTFHFEQYSVGPYVQGIFEVVVPYDVLASIIDESSPLLKFVGN